jgi:hypothetical protein
MRSNLLPVRLGLLSLLVAVAATPVAAQGTITVLGGFVSAKTEVGGDIGSVTFNSRSGVAAGVGYDWALGSSLRFAPEFLFVSKGFEVKDGGDAFGVKIGYVEIPLLVRANLGSAGSSMRPYLLAGPAVAFELSCKLTASAGDVGSASTDCDADEEDGLLLKSVDFGVMFGAGLQFGRYGISARYDLGVADISDFDASEEISYKNRALMILGSIGF